MELRYIHHSCFMIEMEDYYIIFDYYKKDLPELNTDKPIYVFCTHSHGDHYNDKIFSLFKDMKKARYIFSDDVEVERDEILEEYGVDTDKLDISFIGPDSSLKTDDFEVRTLKSTDLGVAYIIDFGDYKIYHAGDLNWWTWAGYESEEEYEAMTSAFKAEIEKIKGEKFKLAMVPLDHRQGERFDWGMKYFLENTDTENVAPMHLWNKFEMIEKFKEINPEISGKTNIINTKKIATVPENIV